MMQEKNNISLEISYALFPVTLQQSLSPIEAADFDAYCAHTT